MIFLGWVLVTSVKNVFTDRDLCKMLWIKQPAKRHKCTRYCK